ncbi:unnamed protein product [Hymenolepis diminuta]|uniref:RRM domain-containing protein n=3 Tax=Hymenolepis diminuta TaxID=6216 RepID=A0A0R3SAN4_HYMDI|nr:unnamed protein product [Hymenolepis diminuta]VUZ39144.1 unnamed protein product [Hymenolepis diminuta]
MSRVYIGRLPSRCSERDIEKFFKGYGRLRDIVLKTGYGFVEFEDERDAEDAVYDLHGRELKGERIIVEHARLPPGRGNDRRRESRYGPPTRTDYRVIVENLSSRVSWQDLKDMMRKAGEVTYADAHKQVRNEGIVEFATYDDMKAAINKYDGYMLYERRLKVYADKPRRRSRSRSGRRSRSRRSSRRGSRRDRSRSGSRRRSSTRRSRSDRDRSRRSGRSRSDESRKSRSGSRSHHSDRSVSHHSNGHRSRSGSRNGDDSAVKARSRSASRDHHSRSLSHDRSRSASRDGSRSRSGSRGRSHRSSSRHGDSRSGSDRRSRSRTPADKSRSVSKSRSRSASRDHDEDSRQEPVERSVDEEQSEQMEN